MRPLFLPLFPYYMAARRKTLKVEADFDFIAIGIVSHLPDYRIAWCINNMLNIALKKTDDLSLSNPELRRQMTFSHYAYEEHITKSVFHVTGNKHEADCLLPEIKEVDYLLVIKGTYYASRKNELLKKIKSINEIQTALLLNMETLKSKNNLVFDDQV